MIAQAHCLPFNIGYTSAGVETCLANLAKVKKFFSNMNICLAFVKHLPVLDKYEQDLSMNIYKSKV